ncbi:Twin-arginine translocation pathway signal [Rubrobacter xylanophilus DSM 9941]|uniref:Cytochrome bc1 complex Rieske iron-sulfur subunit n=1 Tax=Rubrobacter xylanophilus (strain DSM 9941 / JCM 11954 / NBRC 16129 / PRD-1) TaxID=266117 RepID=Q1AZW2_RUBXD|nr:Twin-arginine translocation pathway signal [Rubrobacter xylanophilus DSM 9941]
MEQGSGQISRRSFIRLGTVLGVGAASASVLAACGGGTGGDGAGGGSGGGAGAAEGAGRPPSGEGAIVAASEVPRGEAFQFRDAGRPAVLVHLESGEFVAYSAVCTHQQCTVAYQDGRLACPCHGSVFDPAKGAEVVAGPAPRPLREIPVRLRDGRVYRA